MGKKRKVLSEAEIWDDSALIQSWDDALEEYKLYHSIHARGERVEDIIRATEEEEADMTDCGAVEGNKLDRDETRNGSPEDGEVEDNNIHPPNGHTSVDMREAVSTGPSDRFEVLEAGVARPSNGVPDFPQAITSGSSQDEALKNLMMSWYWAGYYTGHYEGQEQAKQSFNNVSQNN